MELNSSSCNIKTFEQFPMLVMCIACSLSQQNSVFSFITTTITSILSSFIYLYVVLFHISRYGYNLIIGWVVFNIVSFYIECKWFINLIRGPLLPIIESHNFNFWNLKKTSDDKYFGSEAFVRCWWFIRFVWFVFQ